MRLTPVENQRGDAVLGVGSAIVADSDAMTEWRESIVKGGFARKSSPAHTAPQFDLIETMRFDPANGIELLELHLERIKAKRGGAGFFPSIATRHATRFRPCVSNSTGRSSCACWPRAAVRSPLTHFGPAARHLRTGCLPCPAPAGRRGGTGACGHKTTERGFYDDARTIATETDALEALFRAR